MMIRREKGFQDNIFATAENKQTKEATDSLDLVVISEIFLCYLWLMRDK